MIPFKYYNGSGFTDAVFTYNSTVSITSPSVHSASGSYTYDGTTFLEYRASASGLNTNPSYITVDIQPTYSIFDTTQIHSVIALSDGNSTSKYLSTATYQSPAWDWMYDGTHYHIENHDESASGSGYYAYLTHSGRNFTYICADLSSQSLASGYSYRATFSGNQIPTGSYYRLLIGVPYIDDDSSASPGTSDSGGGGGGGGGDIIVTVNVNVDNSGVESRLDDVNSGLADINSALYGQSGQTMPYFDSMENPEYHFDGSTIDDIDQTLRDVPAVISSAAWWWNLAFDVLHLDSAIWSLVPLLCILSLISYMLWRW